MTRHDEQCEGGGCRCAHRALSGKPHQHDRQGRRVKPTSENLNRWGIGDAWGWRLKPCHCADRTAYADPEAPGQVRGPKAVGG